MIKTLNLSCGYQQQPVLQDLSLQIMQDEFCALLGPNGAGKSTLLYTLMGFLKPSEGKVEIAGKELGQYRRPALAKLMAFVPQESHGDFDHSVEDTVLMGRFPYLGLMQSYNAEDKEKVDAVLAMTYLQDLRHRWLSELSGGEKQRVYIARALVQDTPCILLDESLSQLDINHQVEIMILLRKIAHEQHKTVVIVSHNLNLAANYADKMLFLRDGRLIGSGEPNNLMQESILQELFKLPLQTQINPISGRLNVIYP